MKSIAQIFLVTGIVLDHGWFTAKLHWIKLNLFLSWYLLQMPSWLELRLCAHFLLIMLVRCMVEIVLVFWIFHSLCGLVGLSVLFSLEVFSLGSCDTTAIYNISVSSYARFWSLNERWLINTYYLGLGVSKFLPCCILCICVSCVSLLLPGKTAKPKMQL